MTQLTTFDPECTRDMLRAVFGDLPIPKSGEARLASPDLSEVDPAVCRADGALLYGDGDERFGVIVETQRGQDKEKRYSWLEYIANFRAREKCPVALVVICPSQSITYWARKPIETGHPGLTLTPLVIGPDNTPVITDVAEARGNIVLAAICTITKSEDPQFKAIFRTMNSALGGVARGHAWRYSRYIFRSLPPEQQQEWGRLMSMGTYEYHSDFANSLLAEGEAIGEARGEAKAILTFLEARGIAVSDDVRERVMACQDANLLQTWVSRAASVESAEGLFV